VDLTAESGSQNGKDLYSLNIPVKGATKGEKFRIAEGKNLGEFNSIKTLKSARKQAGQMKLKAA